MPYRSQINPLGRLEKGSFQFNPVHLHDVVIREEKAM